MGQGDSRVLSGRDGRGDAGDDFEGDAGFRQCGRFLASSTEQKRIASFEPHHRPAVACGRDQASVDFLLLDARSMIVTDAGGPLAFPMRPSQEQWIDESVVENEIRHREAFAATQGQQSGITGACSNEIDSTNRQRNRSHRRQSERTRCGDSAERSEP